MRGFKALHSAIVAATTVVYITALPQPTGGKDPTEGRFGAVSEHAQASRIPPKFADTEPRIVGDDIVEDDNMYSWTVSLQEEIEPGKWIHMCGGTLLDAKTVLTTAHCLIDSTPHRRIRAGSKLWNRGGVVIPISRDDLKVHDSWQTVDTTMASNLDIGIIKLQESLNETSRDDEVKIQFATLATFDPEAGTNATVVGWGLEGRGGAPNEGPLKYARTRVASREQCGEYLQDDQICTLPSVTGPGDSGGPLMIEDLEDGVPRFSVVGVGKGELPTPDDKVGCYGLVKAVLPWIKSHMEP